MFEHVLELDHELVYILEGAINGGETDVSHVIQLVEFLNHFLSDDYSRYFLLASLLAVLLNPVDQGFHLLNTDRTLLAGFLDPGKDFFAVKLFAASILFDQERKGLLDSFVGREPFAATETFTATPSAIPLLIQAGIDNFIL
jgi:hypothetical protein